MGDEIDLVYGRSLPEKARQSGPVPVFGSNGIVGYHNVGFVEGPGIIIGRKGSAGAVAFSYESFWPIDTTYYVRNLGGNYWRFLYHLLAHLDLRYLNSHSAVPGLTRDAVLSLLASFPDRSEQERIAGLLDRVQHTFELEEKLLATLRELKHAAVQQLLTWGLRAEAQKESAIGSVPESWDIVRLGGNARIGNGSTPKRTNALFWDGGTLPWLTSARVYDRVITKANEFVTPVAAAECHLPLVRAGSLLVAITGQGKTLGNVARTTIDTFVSQHLAYVTFEENGINADFMRHYLSSRYEQLRALGRSGGSTKGAITCAALKEVLVPVPSREEQDDITTILDAIDRKIALHERKRVTLQELFDVLLHDLLSGRIRVVDAAADKLLAPA